ncbi:MAG: ABC transporter permease [Halobacteriaceae archaeon]
MAGDTESFEDIDWDAERGGKTLLPRKYLATAVTLLVLGMAFLYDYHYVPVREPTVPVLGWHVTQVDWLFLATLIVLFYFVVVPLASNRRMTAYYWREFRKNTAAVVSLVYLIGIFVVGIAGPVFMEPPTLSLLEQYQPPVYTTVSANYPIQCVGEVTGAGGNRVCHGTWAHPLGTTHQGKDILTLVVYGMQVSMKVGLIASLLIITIGTTVGAVAAYVGGLVDEVLMRYVDIQLVFPTFLLFLLLIYLFGESLFMFIMVFGLTSWGGVARLVRSEALQRREEEYIVAADSAGASTGYVIWRHIIPNVSNTVITATTLLIPGLLLFEAGLAFIGLGDPSIPSWGQVIAAGRNYLDFAWWISTMPGIFLFMTILAFNFLGDALRDALDPRSTQE